MYRRFGLRQQYTWAKKIYYGTKQFPEIVNLQHRSGNSRGPRPQMKSDCSTIGFSKGVWEASKALKPSISCSEEGKIVQ